MFSELYESRHCVIAVFRMLPPLCQQCLRRMMFTKSRFYCQIKSKLIAISDWRSWSNKTYQLAILNALRMLQKLRILEGELDEEELKINVNLWEVSLKISFSSVGFPHELRVQPVDQRVRPVRTEPASTGRKVPKGGQQGFDGQKCGPLGEHSLLSGTAQRGRRQNCVGSNAQPVSIYWTRQRKCGFLMFKK